MNNGEILSRLQDMYDQCDVKGCKMRITAGCDKCQFAINSVKTLMSQINRAERITDGLMRIIEEQNRELSALRVEVGKNALSN